MSTSRQKKSLPISAPQPNASVPLRENTELLFTYDSIEHNLSHILGRVLTLVDSIVPQGPQNKATKDLIKEAFRSQAQWMAGNANVQRSVQLNVDGVFTTLPATVTPIETITNITGF